MKKTISESKQQVDISTQSQLKNDEHSRLIEWVNSADTDTLDSREIADKCRRYYDSDQWTPTEIATLKRRKQAATVINRIKPKMDTLMGMEKAAKTTAKAFPRTPKHERGAEAATEGIRFVLQDNHFDQTRSAAWDNLLIEGTCGAEIIVKPDGDDYKVIINPLMWDRLIWDAHSRRKDFSDARFLGQVVWMDYDEAASRWPKAKDILDTMVANQGQIYEDQPRWMDNNRRRVKIVELYYRRASGEMYYACFTYGGYLEEPKLSPYIDEEGNHEWPYEFASNFVTRSGARYGAVMQLLDPQDDLNKRRSKFQHLLSVRQVRSERGAVDDVNKARQELAKPDGWIETTPGMEFEVLKTGDMAAAQFQLYQDSKMEMDIVGANSALQGKGASDASGVALRTRQQAGQTEIGPMFDVLRYWQLRVYRKVWNRIRQYWKAEKWVRVTDDETNLRWVGLNRDMTVGEAMMEDAKEQGLPDDQMQQLQQKMMQDPAMQKPYRHNDIAELDMDIIITEVPDVLTAQMEDFQTLGEMVKSGFPIPPLAVIQASPLSNKDQIIKMMKEQPQIPPQVQKQIQQMQEELKKAQEQAQQLAQENQALKADQSGEMAKLSAQDKLKRDSLMAENQLKRESAQSDKEFQVWKAKLDAETKIEVAEIGRKGDLQASAIQAENAANMDLQKSINQQ